MHVGMILEMAADGLGDRVAIGSSRGDLTFAEVGRRARRAGTLLAAAPGANVILVDENSPAVPLALFGAALAGKPFVPVNYRLADDRLRATGSRRRPPGGSVLILGDERPERSGRTAHRRAGGGPGVYRGVMATGVTADSRADAVIANVPGAVYRCRLDAGWTMELISEEIERISGYPAADFVGNRERTFASIIHPEDRSHVEAVVAQAVAAQQTFAPEYRIVRADGSVAWVLERGRVSAGVSNGVPRLDGIIFDVTERKVLEEELHRSLAEESVAHERLRLARDLHDSVGHALTIGTIQVGVARAALHDDPTGVEGALGVIEATLRTAMAEMRSMVDALHGDAQPTRDSGSDLGELVAGARRRGLDIDLRIDGHERALPAAVEVSLYRTAQECLTNCAKYAAGAAISVAVTYDADQVTIAVSDDGTGCAEPSAAGSSGGRGLEGIRQRAAALGGTYEAAALPEGGFRVVASYPA